LSEASFHRGAGFSFIGLSVRRSDGDAALALGNGGANAAIGDLAGFNITGNGNIDIGSTRLASPAKTTPPASATSARRRRTLGYMLPWTLWRHEAWLHQSYFLTKIQTGHQVI
jgi:hypothetical protein